MPPSSHVQGRGVIVAGLRPSCGLREAMMSKLFLIIGFVLSMSTLGLAAATMPPQHTVTAALD